MPPTPPPPSPDPKENRAAPDHQQQTTKTASNGFSQPGGRSKQFQALFGTIKTLESAEQCWTAPKSA
eukprot:9865401-Alexandrium_andersonii.AAC.1